MNFTSLEKSKMQNVPIIIMLKHFGHAIFSTCNLLVCTNKKKESKL